MLKLTVRTVVVVALTGCASAPSLSLAPVPARPIRAVVFCVEGAGNFGGACEVLRRTVAEADLPLEVQSFRWSYGPGRVIADQTDYEHARAAGRKLALEVRELRSCHPGLAIDLVAHSAGSAVALAAAEELPPGSIDRMILVAPAVSTEYDLRPALAACRQGIDVFLSARDFWVLGLGVALVGTTDRHWTTAAGWAGFSPPGDAFVGAYAQLREHPWVPCDVASGNLGGHYGVFRPAYLRENVVPLLSDSACR
jgi:pimeloyl-ACP methyl ester carboxylesterase